MGDFLASARSQTAGDKCIRVYPAEILQRSLPRILGVQMKEACSASLRSECPEACVYLIHDVRF